MRKIWWAPVAALVVVASAAGRQGGEEPLTVRAVRFYSPARATTTIEGVCELRLDALGGAATGAAVRYRVEVSIRDSTGLELQHTGWSREVPAAVARMRGATAVETFEFPAAPGRYQLMVRAIPESGPAVERATSVTAYATRPPLSDLLLATSAHAAAADTGAVAAGEIRRGSLVLQTAPVPHLTPTEAMLSYYAEVYPWQGAALDGQVSVAVTGAGGKSVIATPPRAAALPGGGRGHRGVAPPGRLAGRRVPAAAPGPVG